LTDLDPDSSTYYKAILQNLFFATLNTPVDSREVSQNPNSSSNYLYSDLFAFAESSEILQLFAGIPFLNGGLFECLDQTDSTSPNWIDGFTERDINLVVPNLLLNSPASTVDLSQYIRSGREAKVRGLINILNDYHFTVSESTPIDQDIALDPELLGNIFENLLASYNPETSETARKESGSFYTPSYIVNYMVDAGLKSYFQSRLNLTGDYTSKFDSLFSWEDEQNPFEPEITQNLVEAIAQLKSMDPACGSGAFLMGLLNKLVLILNKLDPKGKLWEQAQENLLAQKLNQNSDLSPNRKHHLKAKLQSSFASPNSNYGRKLYLIENSIFGVDIQPFAIQIAKLRFRYPAQYQIRPTDGLYLQCPTFHFGSKAPQITSPIVQCSYTCR
jgi:adenine-specific DNA-methyltransferase